MTRSHRCGGAKGLTLLEVVLTLTILSMIAVLVLGAVRVGTRSWRRGEARVEAEQRLRIVYTGLAEGLASLCPEMTQGTDKPVVAFRGRPDRLVFHAAPLGHGPLPTAAMERTLAYYVEPGQGLIVQEEYPLVTGTASLASRGRRTVLDPEVTRITFRYLEPGGSDAEGPLWVESWDPRDVPPPSPSPLGIPAPVAATRGIPLAVDVRIERGEGHTARTVAFLVPIRFGQGLARRTAGL